MAGLILRPRRAQALIYGLVVAMIAAGIIEVLYYLGVLTAFEGLLLDGPIYDSAGLIGGALCLLRAWQFAKDRSAWMLFGLALLANGIGDSIWTWFLRDAAVEPSPSPSDPAYLISYALAGAGLLSLMRSRLPGTRLSLRMDGVVGAVTTAALCTALLIVPLLGNLPADPAAAAITAAYPVADVVLIAIVVGVLALTGWRLGRQIGLLLLGLTAIAVGDLGYLTALEGGSAVALGDWFEVLWPISNILVALAAWQPQTATRRRAPEGSRELLVPCGFALAGTALLTIVAWDSGPTIALMAAAAPLAAIARMALAVRENQVLLTQVRTDSLTGLGNRGKLTNDLDDALRTGQPQTISLFDLDGFKLYNDTYGHPAGDALLRRLGARLARTVAGRGEAYRIGGDEFCVIVPEVGPDPSDLVKIAAQALGEQGEGFLVTASHGIAVMPDEGATAELILQVADRRMYQVKDSNRASARNQAQEVLLGALAEREPKLRDHLMDVARLATEVAKAIGLDDAYVDRIERAAKLHDVGKVAIPDAILSKPGPFDRAELDFIRRHTIFGERIVSAAPALAAIGPIIRASHERWDGGGYPDGLAGGEIPLEARVVFACDAFDAMVSIRPYSSALAIPEALAEMRRCSGSQFDPRVVKALCAVVTARNDTPAIARR